MTSAQGALFSALYNIASGIGRIAFGFLADMVFGVSDLFHPTPGFLEARAEADLCWAYGGDDGYVELDGLDYGFTVDLVEFGVRLAVQCKLRCGRRVSYPVSPRLHRPSCHQRLLNRFRVKQIRNLVWTWLGRVLCSPSIHCCATRRSSPRQPGDRLCRAGAVFRGEYFVESLSDLVERE